MIGRIQESPSLILLLILIQGARMDRNESCPNAGAGQVIFPTGWEFYGLSYNLEVTFKGSPRTCFKVKVDAQKQAFRIIFCDKTYGNCLSIPYNYTVDHSEKLGQITYRLFIHGSEVFIFGCQETEIANHEEYFWATTEPELYPTEEDKRTRVEWWYKSHGLDISRTVMEFPECYPKLQNRLLKIGSTGSVDEQWDWKYFYLIFGVGFCLFVIFFVCK